MNEFRKIESQEQLDAILAERLRRERKKIAVPVYRKLVDVLADLYEVTKALEKWCKD